MAKQAQVSDWITRTRQLYGDALNLFGRYQALAQEAVLTGRVVVTEQGVTTNLTPENFIGENAELDVTTFVGAFAMLGQTFAAVDDSNTALLYESR
jgi:hypothetical protein